MWSARVWHIRTDDGGEVVAVHDGVDGVVHAHEPKAGGGAHHKRVPADGKIYNAQP